MDSDPEVQKSELVTARKASHSGVPSAHTGVEQRIMITAITPFIFIASFLLSNVRGQGTRHLVEGTLDPIVGPNYFHSDVSGLYGLRSVEASTRVTLSVLIKPLSSRISLMASMVPCLSFV